MWLYENSEYIEYDDNYYGFVYEITNEANGKKYIGRKFFTSAGYKQVKGKRKKIRKESDWKNYFGSSPAIKKAVEEFGEENFTRKILKLCKSRGECNYWETKYIFDRDAILDGNYYNGWVSCKIQSSHVKNLLYNQDENTNSKK